MRAKDKFELKDRVKPTTEAIEAELGLKKDARGTVVGFGRDPSSVSILVDGKKTPSTYHMDYWFIFERII